LVKYRYKLSMTS